MRRRSWLMAAAVGGARAASPLHYPRPQGALSDHDYCATVLREALQAADWPADVRASRLPMAEPRWLRELQADTGSVDVGWAMTSEALEQRLCPVRVPLCMGLFGWRLLLLRAAEAERAAGVQQLQQLAGWRLASCPEWADTAILRANGLRVVEAGDRSSLLQLLRLGRADACPRAAIEVLDDLEQRAHGLALDPHLVLHYPAALYFFTARRQQALAETLERGLWRLHRSGRLQALQQQWLLPDVAALRLRQRHVLPLRHALPAGAPPPDHPLWFQA